MYRVQYIMKVDSSIVYKRFDTLAKARAFTEELRLLSAFYYFIVHPVV